MRKYPSLKPCAICKKTPTRAIEYRKGITGPWVNLHVCIEHDPFEDFKDDAELKRLADGQKGVDR
jgi:hypothetical protein